MSVSADILSQAAAVAVTALGATFLFRLVGRRSFPGGPAAKDLADTQSSLLDRVRHHAEPPDPFPSVFERSPAAMLWLSLQGRVIRANRSAASFLGFSVEELVGTSYEDLRDIGQESAAFTLPTSPEEGGTLASREWRYRHKDRGWVSGLEAATYIQDDHGAYVGILVTIEDLTLLKRAEVRVGVKGHLLDSLRQAVISTDLSGSILSWNKHAELVFGWSATEVVGRPLADLAAPIIGRAPVEEMIKDIGCGRSWSGEFLVRRRDKSAISTWTMGSPLCDSDRKIVGIVAISRDTESEDESARALHEERRTLELLNRTASVLNAKLDLGPLLQTITDTGVELTGASFGALFFRSGDRFNLVALAGADKERFGHSVGELSIDSLPFVSSAVLRCDDLATDRIAQIAASAMRLSGSSLQITSVLAVPLIARSGDVRGGLFFTDPRASHFSARLEKLMEGIAAHARIAIENARLFHGARQEIETRRKAEQSLNVSEARFRDFAQVASDILWETDSDHRIVSVVGDTMNAFGTTQSEIIGKTRWEFCGADPTSQQWHEHFQTVQTHRPFQDFEYAFHDAENGTRWISSSGRPMLNETGEFIGYRGASTDITARKSAERRAARNAVQQQAVAAISQLALQDISAPQFFETAAIIIARSISMRFVGLFTLSADGTALCLEGSRGWAPERESRRAFPLLSFPRLQQTLRRAAVVAMPASELGFIGPHQRDDTPCWAVAIGDLIRPHGILVVGDPNADSIDVADDDFLRALAFVLATSIDKRRAESVLQLRDRALESLDLGIVIVDSARIERPIIYVNAAFEAMTGIDKNQALGRNIDLLLETASDEATLEAIHAALDRDESYHGTVVASRLDGSTFSCDLAISPILSAEGIVKNAVFILSDVTEREQLEAQLRQAQKMQAVGHLTGGVAHDFNNLLAVILGNAEILFEDTTDPDLKVIAELVMTTAERGAELTQQLLAFGRRQALRTESVDIGDTIKSLSGMLRRTLGEQISLVTLPVEEECRGLVDQALFESAILNLAVNARDAMTTGGILVIGTRLAHLSRDEVPELSAGGYILVEVKDTGVGMPRDVLDNVFEPFFTTKDVGKGSGLGLPMVYGFAKQSGGHVSITSQPGQGTTVTLYLPEAATDAPHASATSSRNEASPGGVENILLVEDEPEVRRFVSRQLSGLGYEVIEAGDGASALSVLNSECQIDLLFSDLVLPGGISGFQLLKKARDLRPGLRAVLTTGFAQEFGTADAEIVDPILRKPYKRHELAKTIREALTRKAA